MSEQKSGPSNPEFRAFENRDIASVALAAELGEILEAAIHSNGSAALVVSGGTTPGPMFRQLRERVLDWNRVTVLASDERDVPPDHPDRNERMIREELLQGPAHASTLCSLIPPGDIPGRFDAVVLGMGGDGHTASLFPGSPELDRALTSPGPLQRVTAAGLAHERVSLTAPTLLSAERIFLLFFGEEKKAVYDRAILPGPVGEFPVRVVLHQDRVPVTIFWAD